MPSRSETKLRKLLNTVGSPNAMQPVRVALFDALRRMSSNWDNLENLRLVLVEYRDEAIYRRDNGLARRYNNTQLYNRCPNDPLGVTQGLRRVLARGLDRMSNSVDNVEAYRQDIETIRGEAVLRRNDYPDPNA